MQIEHSGQAVGFLVEFEALFGKAATGFESRQEPGRGPRPKLAARQLLASLVYHVMSGGGWAQR